MLPSKYKESMIQNIFVREANGSDISTLINYNQALAYETENIALDENILRLGIGKALELKDCHYFVAELNGKIVGQSMITSEWSDWRNGVMWWIQSVYVDPNHRQRGVFQSILKYIEALVEKHPEVKGLRLYVKKDNTVGVNAYESLGIKNSGYLIQQKYR